MPIKSYLAHPHSGMKEELVLALSQFSECDIFPSENKDVVILITETATTYEDDKLTEKIQRISSLKLLAMVSGFNTPN